MFLVVRLCAYKIDLTVQNAISATTTIIVQHVLINHSSIHGSDHLASKLIFGMESVITPLNFEKARTVLPMHKKFGIGPNFNLQGS